MLPSNLAGQGLQQHTLPPLAQESQQLQQPWLEPHAQQLQPPREQQGDWQAEARAQQRQPPQPLLREQEEVWQVEMQLLQHIEAELRQLDAPSQQQQPHVQAHQLQQPREQCKDWQAEVQHMQRLQAELPLLEAQLLVGSPQQMTDMQQAQAELQPLANQQQQTQAQLHSL